MVNIIGCWSPTGLHSEERDPANPTGICTTCGQYLDSEAGRRAARREVR